jgi:NTE family protein
VGIFSWLFRLKKQRKIKVGLALGSGGAKGFAEIGALKAFEEHNISFDIIAGTSIGSVVGSFYAQGYSSTDILEMIKRINPAEIKSTFMIKMDTIGLKKVIERELGVSNIEELEKPFACIATDVESGLETVFKSGDIASAICASSCFPPFFKPVERDGKKYIDGAFTNSIPADVVREMGADYVVGIDLSNHEAKPGLLSKIFPTYKTDVEEPWAKGYANSDVMLHPNLVEFKPISFGRAEEMFDIGYNLALEFVQKIKEDIEKLKTVKKK